MMRYASVITLALAGLVVLAVPSHVRSQTSVKNQTKAKPTKVPIAERIAILKQQYPDLIYSVTNNTLRLMNNRLVVIDDGDSKSLRKKRKSADIEDQLSQIYPLGKCYKGRLRNLDPGEIRSISFLHSAYGANQYQVKKATEMIDWFGMSLRFSSRHGAADALRRVRDELAVLPKEFQATVRKSRTFEWRNLANTKRLDVHAFAIAIDLNSEMGDNWRGPRARRGRVRRYKNRVHPSIVEIFERHGFIWGGKWYHYETNHFEYRPELIAIGKLAQKRGCER